MNAADADLEARNNAKVDLLTRASATLRKHASAASFGIDGWKVDPKDGEVTTVDGGWMVADTMESSKEQHDASYIALMHPPVALALAELLDEAAGYASMQPHRGDWTLVNQAVEIAEQVLRVPAEATA